MLNVEDSACPHTCDALRADLLHFPARVIQYGEGVVPVVPCALRTVLSIDELRTALWMYPSVQHLMSRSTPIGPCFDRNPTGGDFAIEEESLLDILDTGFLCDRSASALSDFSRPNLSALIGMMEWSPALQAFFNRKVQREGTVTLREIGLCTFGELMADTRGDLPMLVELSATLECAVAAFQVHCGDPISVCDPSGAEPMSFDDCWLALSPDSDGKRESWVDYIHAVDPRFRSLLGRYRSLETMVNQSVDDNDWLALDQLSEIGTRISAMRDQTVEQESLRYFFALLDSTGEKINDRWKTLLLMRLGLAGHERQTLAAVGNLAGVTRERVRQIQYKATRSLGELPRHWMPRLDRAIETAESMAPIFWDDLKTSLVGDGLVETGTTLTAFKSLAQFAGREVSWTEDGLVATELDGVFVRAVAKSGRRVSDANGVGSLDLVMRSLASDFQAYSESDVRTCLLLSSEVHWLSDRYFWTDHGRGRNRAVNTAQRILKVHSPQSVESLLRGTVRSFSWRSSTGGRLDLTCPTLDALDLFFRDHPSFEVSDSGLVTSAIRLDTVDLGREKSIIVDVLRGAPFPALGRTELVRKCLEAGMSSGTIGVYTTYAEILERIDDGIWALRGTEVPQDYIAALKSEVRTRSKLFEKHQVSGLGRSNRPWVALRLSEPVCQSCVLQWNFHVEAIRGVDFSIVDAEDGETLGTAKLAKGFNYGYSAIFRKHHVAEGTTMRLTFFVDEGYVLTEFGADDLLSEPPDLG